MITLKQKNNYILHNQRPFQNKNQLMYFISLSLCLYFCPVQKAVIHFSFIDGKKGGKNSDECNELANRNALNCLYFLEFM